MQIILAKTAGFCFGVKRAVDIVYDMIDNNNEKMYTLGPIIHNEQVVNDLASKGVNVVNDINQIKDKESKIIIRTHGISKYIYNNLEENKIDFIEATCPYVKKIHKIVEKYYNEGYQTIIIGNSQHPEVEGINGWCNNSAIIIDTVDDIKEYLQEVQYFDKICVVAQTTFNRETWKVIIQYIQETYANVKIFDTICSATNSRQKEAKEIAIQVDIMIVIGGKYSSNTQKLVQICSKYCKNTYYIQTFKDLPQKLNFYNKKIGITAGASTPAWIIKEVIDNMTQDENLKEEKLQGENEMENLQQDIENNDEVETETEDKNIQVTTEEQSEQTDDSELQEDNNEMNFAEAFEKRELITLNTGDTVKGTVIEITDNEVYVDLQYKSDGIITLAELTNDPNLTTHDIVKVNDVIDVFIILVNDGEGKVLLSKKKLDIIKAWDTIENAFENKTTIKGKVIEIVKGGIIALVSDIRVFIPASQVSNKFVSDFNDMLNQEVSLRIIDFNQKRRKLVGSIRVILQEEQKEKEEQFWNDIEVGKTYSGKVKRLTSFGAFVDLGAVDGLIHISELSWGRIKHPSEILNEGDIAEVYVIDFDKESKRISLGFKKAEDNPWEIARTKFNVDDIVKCKVVRLVPFGAFVELIPHVDGLVHISQIAHERIGKPSDVLSVGEEIEAKIIETDVDNQKISLSIKELIKQEKIAEEIKNIEESQEKSEEEDVKVTIGDILNDKEKVEEEEKAEELSGETVEEKEN